MMSATEPGLGGGTSLDCDGAPMQSANATRDPIPLRSRGRDHGGVGGLGV